VQAARWFVMLLIGILTALVASCIDMSVRELTNYKFKFIHYCIHFALCNFCEDIDRKSVEKVLIKITYLPFLFLG